jgi:hypothetical protein
LFPRRSAASPPHRYDEVGDPRELHNLAADPKFQKTVTEMQGVLRRVTGQ